MEMITKYQYYFFSALLIGTCILTAVIFLPYLAPLVIAIVLSVLFRPVYRWIAKVEKGGNERNGAAAFITLVIVVVLIITPLIFIAGKISSEGQSLYVYLTNEENRSNIITTLNDNVLGISQRVFGFYPDVSFENFDITHYIRNVLQWSVTNVNSIFSSAAKIVLDIFIILFAMFYMLRDGAALKRSIISLSPLSDTDDGQILGKLEQAVQSVIRGSLIVGIIQGILTGIGFMIFGIPNATLWGSLAIFAALVPGVGTALILIPGVIYLFFAGSTGMAIGLLIWAVVAVGLIDNFLGPMLMKRGIKIHQFLIFLSVVGGIMFFGPIGFILGPLVIALLFALLEIQKNHLAPNM
jgi:predicted PurR-regulated permease PerM